MFADSPVINMSTYSSPQTWESSMPISLPSATTMHLRGDLDRLALQVGMHEVAHASH